MKKLDLTHAGGFPLTQDNLDYLQQAYIECTNAFAQMGGTGPAIISGMVITTSISGTAVTDGWLFYNGEMIKFNAASVGIPTGSDVVMVDIIPASTSLTYNDGSVYPAILDKAATLSLAPTATTATQFPLSTLQPFGVGFGESNREAGWQQIAVSTPAASGGVTGTIYYKKNFLANTLQVRGNLTCNNAQNFAASPTSLFYTAATLPTEYIPANNTSFLSVNAFATAFKDDLGIAWVRQINGYINTTGQIYFGWIRPDISVGAYIISFNQIIPLD